MPSTTKTLEHFAGHCNSVIPGHNEFFHSILKWSTSVQHNFNHATHRAETLARATSKDEPAQQKTFYETHISRCKRDQISQYTAIYECTLAYCHRLSLGVAPRTMTDPLSLAHSSNPTEFALEKNLRTRGQKEVYTDNSNLERDHNCSERKHFLDLLKIWNIFLLPAHCLRS
jgi:hypothetical protein